MKLENKIKVLVKLDENNVVTQINSSIFLYDTEDWIEIDEGVGYKYSHAQGNYLPLGLMDNNGKYNYKYENELLIELSDEDKELLFPTPTPQPSTEERVKTLETELNVLLGMEV